MSGWEQNGADVGNLETRQKNKASAVFYASSNFHRSRMWHRLTCDEFPTCFMIRNVSDIYFVTNVTWLFLSWTVRYFNHTSPYCISHSKWANIAFSIECSQAYIRPLIRAIYIIFVQSYIMSVCYLRTAYHIHDMAIKPRGNPGHRHPHTWRYGWWDRWLRHTGVQ